jgi:hypothetical protein
MSGGWRIAICANAARTMFPIIPKLFTSTSFALDCSVQLCSEPQAGVFLVSYQLGVNAGGGSDLFN